ncbi:MAG: response regulator [Simkaniaceae bacterium]|nr:response regulator [Simkaniaceae bacterium]
MDTRALKKIMIIDDDDDLLKLIEFSFKKHPTFEVKYQNSGEEAVQVAINDPPDFILIDVMMPQMNGFQVLQALKNIPKLKATVFVFFTAKARENEVKDFLKEGAYDVITKPFDVIKLPQIILDIWQRYNASY